MSETSSNLHAQGPIGPSVPPITPSKPEKSAVSVHDDASVHADDDYPDGGRKAWLVVLGTFMYSCAVMGWAMSWGVFQDYYHRHVFPEIDVSLLTLVGGSLNFAQTATSYLAGGLGERYGYKRMIGISSILSFLCIFATSWCTTFGLIFFFQGFLQGIVQGLQLPLIMALPSQWFLRRRGLATGIACSGAGIGGAVISLVMRQLLTSVGYQHALLIYSFVNGATYLVAWFLIDTRRPAAKRRWMPRKINGNFYSITLAMFFSNWGYLTPYFFITTFTKAAVPSLDENSLLPAVPLIVMSTCNGVGRIFSGFVADALGPINSLFISFFLGGLSQILLWTFSRTYAVTLVFSVVYGLIGGWYVSLIPVVCAELFGVEGLGTITGWMVLVTAPGQFAGGSVGGAILSAAGNDWRALSFYAGALMILGALFVLYARFKTDRHLITAV
ncbi:major facilitator superfamily domain-containing protein [Schizophyllum amplum]|uniref:Major facilitator superfamily domain-containing protein n=1 Tax=Schizophyllum amplum TaxID=97359 RepID=A0A550BS98_9AGAR|nr:major facilitator superfamily domain-containing protein [Auriculariopsis ampla]